jgi:hypothetical protein
VLEYILQVDQPKYGVPLCSYGHVCIVCHLQTNQELVSGQVEMAHQLGHLKEKNAEHQIRPFVVDLENMLGVSRMCCIRKDTHSVHRKAMTQYHPRLVRR